MRKLIRIALPAFLIAGCTVGPNYKRPTLNPPANFYTAQQAIERFCSRSCVVGSSSRTRFCRA